MENYSNGLFLIKLIKHRIENYSSIRGKSNLNTRDQFSRNALYWAISYQKVDDVKLLLAHDIDIMVAPDLNALHHAIELKNSKIIDLISEHVGEEEMALSA